MSVKHVRFPFTSILFSVVLSGAVFANGTLAAFAQPVEDALHAPDSVRQADSAHRSTSRAPLTATERGHLLWDEVASPGLLLASAGPALFDQVADEPASWRNDVVGYGLRVGSNAGSELIESGTAHGLAAVTRLDLRFRRWGHGGVGERVRYATLETVTARTLDGTRVPNAPRIVGLYGAALAQQRWEQLDGTRPSTPGVRWQSGGVRPGDAALSTVLGMGIDITVNVIREFSGGS